ncbi:MAG: hypothetical protein AB7U83_24900 [Vicinamibacterales bacterium]
MPLLVRRLLAAGAIAAGLWPAWLAAQARERVAFVTLVERASGQPVTELSPDDIAIREDGVRREVLRISRATGPMHIAVLIDNSAAAEAAIPNIRTGLTRFLAALGDLGPVTLVTMADRPTLLVDYTSNATLLAAGVGRVFSQPGSGVLLLDAVLEASDGLIRREGERAAIVVLSAQGVEYSTLHHARPLGRLKQAGASLHAVLLNPPGRGDFTVAAQQRDTLIDRGVRETGGLRRNVLTDMAFGDALVEIARVLTHQFRVVYARPQTLIPPDTIAVAAARPGFIAYGSAARGQTP